MDTFELWPWLGQVVPWIIGGAGITGLVTTFLDGKRDHRRWLRDQKAQAYSDVYLAAQRLAGAIQNMDHDIRLRRELVASFGFEEAVRVEELAAEAGPEGTEGLGVLPAAEAEAARTFLQRLEASRESVAAAGARVTEANARLAANLGTVGLFAPAAVEKQLSALLDDVSAVQAAAARNLDFRGGGLLPQSEAALAALRMTRSLQQFKEVLRKDLNVRG